MEAPTTRPHHRPARILVVTGEASGDLQGAALIEALLRIDPTIDIVAVGGDRIRATGVPVLEDSSTWGFIGIWDAIIRLPVLWLVWERLKRAVRRARPDLVIFIDCPGFNMRLAAYARKRGLHTLYYFPPSAWTKNPKRVRTVGQRVDHVVATFEYTRRMFEKAGQPIHYFGHPVIDTVKPAGTVDEVRTSLGLPAGKRCVGLLPGSRRAEIGRIGPDIFRAAAILARSIPDLHFVVPVASPAMARLVRETVGKHGADLPVTVVDGGSNAVMTVADLLIMTSGSASLEATVHETPMILVYRMARFDYFVAGFVLTDFTYMGLPNLMMEQMVVPELLQNDANPVRIAAEAEALLTDPERYQQMKDNLSRVKKQLGPLGVVDRVAKYIWETVSNGP